ncbi:hypothetical protein JTP77_003625 [Streptomyces sp. S9]|nr:hypothetical protein [Streptomyces sp. S9]
MRIRSVVLPALAAAGMLIPVAHPATAVPAPTGAADLAAVGRADTADADVIAESERLRREFGFEAGAVAPASVMRTGPASAVPASASASVSTDADAASLVNEWGFIGTAAETAEMQRRDALTAAVEPVVQKFGEEKNFAGQFLDTEHGGRLVVQFADALPAKDARDDLTAKAVSAGSSAADVEFRVVQRSSQELTDAMKAVWEWDDATPDTASVASVEEDVQANRLNVALTLGTDPAAVREALGTLGVPTHITASKGADDLACTSRTVCDSPRRGGVGITMPSGGGCTVGWVVKKGSTWGAVTAGHCDWGRNSGTVKSGAAYGTLTGDNALKSGTHADMRFIKIASNAKPWLYQNNSSKARVVKNQALGSVGSSSCLFGRNSATPTCGKITSTNASRRSDTCGCVVYGQSAATFAAKPGDSGGAVASSATGATARGILSGADGTGKMHYSSLAYTSVYGMGKLATG